MRFSAPADVTGVSLAAGEFTVVNGHVDVPDDIGEGDARGLLAHGFVAAHEGPPTAKTSKAAKVDAPVVSDEVAVSIVNLGFGKFQRVNAAGERFGDKIKKAEAEALGLPIVKAK